MNSKNGTEDKSSKVTKPSALTETEMLRRRTELDEEAYLAVKTELEYYKEKTFQLDNTVFQMRTLLQSGKGFSEISELSQLLVAFMAVCREKYAFLSSAVLLQDDLDPEDVFYRVRSYFKLPNTFRDKHGQEEEMYMFKFPYDKGLLWQIIQQGDVFPVRDMIKRPRFKTAFNKWNLDVLDSDIWVPLIRGSNVLGILTLGGSETGTPIPEIDFAFLKEIATIAAVNIDSTLRYEKNERILKNLKILYDINQQLANVNDFKQLTVDTLAAAVEALSAQKANLMLYNKETEQLEIKVVWGNIPESTRNAINRGWLDTKPFALGEGVAGMAAKTQKPIRVNDRSRIEQFGRHPVYCIMCVPLIYGDELKGVITLTNKVKRDKTGELIVDTVSRYGEEDEQLLLSLADQAAANLNKSSLYNASITDKLTGLYNARHFESTLTEKHIEASNKKHNICLGIADIDHFKAFNDIHGHKAGDTVLRHTANILRSIIRPETDDLCFRYGGEEFCILLPDTNLETATAILEEFRQKVESTEVDHKGKNLKITISVGIASSSESNGPAELFEIADKALYSAKNNGRNCVKVAENELAGAMDA